MRTILLLALLLAACRGRETSSARPTSQPQVSPTHTASEDSERVRLRAQELPAPSNEVRSWRLRFGDGPTAGAFEFWFRTPHGGDLDVSIPVTRGCLRRVASTDGRAFIRALAKAFGADTTLGKVLRADSLLINVGVLGMHLVHGPGKSQFAGEFTADQPGDWIVTKLFLAEGEPEVFLALNPRSGEAQLIAKDAEYANAVVGEFARLF